MSSVLELARQHNTAMNVRPAPPKPNNHVKLRPKWPIVSDGAAVHPSQVKEFTEFAKSKGTPVEYRPTGEPVFTSHKHQRQALHDRGLHNKQNYC